MIRHPELRWHVVAYDRNNMPVEIANADTFSIGHAAFNAAKIVSQWPRLSLLEGDRVVKTAEKS